jgi:hypothetical protein
VTPVLAGSFAVPPPEPREVQTQYHGTGVVLPANTHVRITVTGTLAVGQNPDRDHYCTVVAPWYGTHDPSCPSGAWAGHTYGPLGVTPGSEGSPLEVRFRVRGGSAIQEVRLSPWFYDRFGATADFLNATDGELEIGRGISTCYSTWSGVDDRFDSGSVDCYAFSGMQTVRVEIFRESSRLTLACTPSVERGAPVKCTVSSDPVGGRVQVTDWKFEGGGITVSDSANPHPLEWSGVMVQSGSITVTATVNGQGPQTASAQVAVTDRDWLQKAPVFTVQEIQNGDDKRLTLPADVGTAADLGATRSFEKARDTDPRPDPTAEVRGGPNDGLAYFRDLSFAVYMYYVLNHAAMSRGSTFYEAQPSENGTGSSIRMGGMNWCGRTVVTNQLTRLVREHELKHVEVYRAAFIRDIGPVLKRLEPRVSMSGTELWDEYSDGWDALDHTAAGESRAIHRGHGNPNLTTPSNTRGECVLRNSNGEELKNAPDA